MSTKNDSRLRRARRARARMRTLGVNRLSVHRTPRHIYAQVIAPEGDKVLASASTLDTDLRKSATGNIDAAAAVGKMVVSEKITHILAGAIRKGDNNRTSMLAKLTSREHDILKQISKGLSNKLIARELGISDGTVKVHVKHILKKLELRSRVEAAVWMINQNNA